MVGVLGTPYLTLDAGAETGTQLIIDSSCVPVSSLSLDLLLLVSDKADYGMSGKYTLTMKRPIDRRLNTRPRLFVPLLQPPASRPSGSWGVHSDYT